MPPYKLSDKLKCTYCRTAKQKCSWSQSERCDRCIRWHKPCSEGRPSPKGQVGSSREASSANDDATEWDCSMKDEPLSTRSNSVGFEQEERQLQIDQGVSIQRQEWPASNIYDGMDFSGSFDPPVYIPCLQEEDLGLQASSQAAGTFPLQNYLPGWNNLGLSGNAAYQTLPYNQDIQQQCVGIYSAPDYGDIEEDSTPALDLATYPSESPVINSLQQHHPAFPSQTCQQDNIYNMVIAQQFFAGPDRPDIMLNSTNQYNPYIQAPAAYPHTLPSLTMMEPSNHRKSNIMTFLMDKRLENLWGNEQAFADTNLVTPLFSRQVSEFFGLKCRVMALKNAIVWAALYTCVAADALMNLKLPLIARRLYEQAYLLHSAEARRLMEQGFEDLERSLARRESPDVLPLYYATFLLHAASACRRGKSGSHEIDAALGRFIKLERHTGKKQFPLGIEVLGASENSGWKVRMFLAKHPDDPGMELSPTSFILGWKRVEYDQAEALSFT